MTVGLIVTVGVAMAVGQTAVADGGQAAVADGNQAGEVGQVGTSGQMRKNSNAQISLFTTQPVSGLQGLQTHLTPAPKTITPQSR